MKSLIYFRKKLKLALLLINFFAVSTLQLSSQTTSIPSTCTNLDFSQKNFNGWQGRSRVYPANSPDANNCNQNAKVFVNCQSASGLSCNGCFSGCSNAGICTAPGVPLPGANTACVNPPLTGATIGINYPDNTGISPGRQTIITNSVPDPYACNNIMTLPAGDQACARLGNGGRNQFGTPAGNTGVGWEIDYLSYTFLVDKSNSLLTYKYAVVLQDPIRDPNNPRHTPAIRPRFNVYVRDSTLHQLIDPICGKFEVVYDTAITGFRTCPLNGPASITAFGGNPFASVGTAYRAWTTVSVDLRQHMGNLVTITFNTWDCGWGGHFGYAYVTARCDTFAIAQSGCNPDGSVTLTAPPGFSYSWLPGGQTTQTISVKGSMPGDTITALLTTANGCTTDVYTVIYPTTVTAIMKPEPLVACVQENKFSFTDSSYSVYSGNGQNVPIVKWEWNFGDGSTSSDRYPTHSYKTPGTYSVTLTATNLQGCQNTTQQIVVVLPPPNPIISTSDVCLGKTVVFEDLSTVPIGAGTIDTWSWSFGDNTSSQDTNPQHHYANVGTYSVNLKVTSTIGCWASTNITVNVWQKPLAAFSGITACLGDSTLFKDMSKAGDPMDPIHSWIWEFGDGTPLNGAKNPNHEFLDAKTYKVQLIVTSLKGCLDDTAINISVLPLPKADFEAKPICFGAPVVFADKSTFSSLDPINSWSWSFGDGTTGTSQSPSHLYKKDSIYQGNLVVKTAAGCKSAITKPILIPPIPQADLDANKYKGCVPLCVTFYDLTFSPIDAVAKWDWDFGDGGTDKVEKPYHCYNDTGVFTVSLNITTVNGCKQSFTWFSMIHVYPYPVAEFDFTPKDASVKDPEITFIYQAEGAKAWQWNLGDGNASIDLNPVHTYKEEGKYTVWQYVQNKWGCRDSIAKVVVISPEWAFYVPNAFSPNGDGKNDFFIGKGYNIKDHQMWIFDRWGNQNYTTGTTSTLDDAIPWNGGGKDENKMAPEDVYVWVVQFKDIYGVRHRLIGHVSLVR